MTGRLAATEYRVCGSFINWAAGGGRGGGYLGKGLLPSRSACDPPPRHFPQPPWLPVLPAKQGFLNAVSSTSSQHSSNLTGVSQHSTGILLAPLRHSCPILNIYSGNWRGRYCFMRHIFLMKSNIKRLYPKNEAEHFETLESAEG